MKRKFHLITVLLVLLSGVVSAQAATPLEQLLTAMPATAFSDGYFSYVDYQALVAARPDAAPPTEAVSMDDHRQTPAGQQYFQTMLGVSSGFSGVTRYLYMADNVAQSMGIFLPAIGQSAEAGLAPRQQVWLQGGIDAESVTAALTARHYQQVGDTTSTPAIWCLDGNCTTGTRVQFELRDPSFLFGGELGANWPVLLDDQRIAAAPDATVFQAIASSNSPRLMDMPEVSDLYQSLTGYAEGGVISQLYMLKPNVAFTAPPTDTGLNAVAVTHMESADALHVIIAMHFSSADEAAAAQTAMPGNIENAVLRTGQPVTHIVEDFSGTPQEPMLIETKNGVVLLVPFAFPPQSEVGKDVASAMPFQSFSRMLIQRDFDWVYPSSQ